MIREDFLTTQYIWAMENEHVFLTKAMHQAERGHFRQFCTLVQQSTRDLRREIDDIPSSVEWSYLFIEMWGRVGGHAPNYGWHSQDADQYHQQRRLLAESLAIKPTNPCELAPEPEKEEPMSNKITFSTITYINGADVTKMTDEQLIDAIKTIEGEIAALSAVKTKSSKITTKIAEAESTLAQVVAVLDAR